MRLKKITIKGLFGMFDHEIPLNMDERLTIIYGPNGIGKTILLTLLYNVIKENFFNIYETPFDDLCLFFEEDSKITITRKTDKTRIIEYALQKNDKSDQYSIPVPEQNESKTIIANPLWNSPADLLKIETPKIDNVAKNSEIRKKWYHDLLLQLNIFFINTQRLIQQRKTEDRLNINFGKQSIEYVNTVIEYSNELAKNILQKHSEYGEISQHLDRTFPPRLLNGKIQKSIDSNEIKTRMGELSAKREKLIQAGLIEDEGAGLDIDELEIEDPKDKNVLTLYINDVEKKLSVFDDLFKKINILKSIVNQRFQYKKMYIDKKKGYYFKTFDGKEIPLSKLSSGEQHEIVLLYSLLFKVKPDSLILIDEPEISLHIAWQNKFLDDMLKVIDLVGIDVLVATHSPDIIQDKMDLAVELKGPDHAEIHNSGKN